MKDTVVLIHGSSFFFSIVWWASCPSWPASSQHPGFLLVPPHWRPSPVIGTCEAWQLADILCLQLLLPYPPGKQVSLPHAAPVTSPTSSPGHLAEVSCFAIRLEPQNLVCTCCTRSWHRPTIYLMSSRNHLNRKGEKGSCCIGAYWNQSSTEAKVKQLWDELYKSS